MRLFKAGGGLAVTGLLACVAGGHAAVLCVSADGAYPCYPRIADAVKAAAPGDTIQVGPGTYHESITITKPVSLTTDNAIVDATGLSRGFFIDGMGAPGLAQVNLSGFTIRNAQYEGVLVLNSSAVTVSNNVVTGNNKGLLHGTCPGLDAFETNEGYDCGEGIHLMGVDHSVVTNNTSMGNSGGILLSDDTGATHHNLVSFNNVSETRTPVASRWPHTCPMAPRPKQHPSPGFGTPMACTTTRRMATVRRAMAC